MANYLGLFQRHLESDNQVSSLRNIRKLCISMHFVELRTTVSKLCCKYAQTRSSYVDHLPIRCKNDRHTPVGWWFRIIFTQFPVQDISILTRCLFKSEIVQTNWYVNALKRNDQKNCSKSSELFGKFLYESQQPSEQNDSNFVRD